MKRGTSAALLHHQSVISCVLRGNINLPGPFKAQKFPPFCITFLNTRLWQHFLCRLTTFATFAIRQLHIAIWIRTWIFLKSGKGHRAQLNATNTVQTVSVLRATPVFHVGLFQVYFKMSTEDSQLLHSFAAIRHIWPGDKRWHNLRSNDACGFHGAWLAFILHFEDAKWFEMAC